MYIYTGVSHSMQHSQVNRVEGGLVEYKKNEKDTHINAEEIQSFLQIRKDTLTEKVFQH